MLFVKSLFFWMLSLQALLRPCHCRHETHQHVKISRIETHRLPPCIHESSGLAFWNDTLATINDSGGNPLVYRISRGGELIDSVRIAGSRNVDWEEIAVDTAGNLFIGDFGNNFSARKDLGVYEVRPGMDVKTFGFSYANQEEFPPGRKRSRVFDCEAMVPYGNSLLLFTKCRKTRSQSVYKLELDKECESHPPMCKLGIRGWVTGATRIDANTFALLTYGSIYVCEFIDSGHEAFVNVLCCKKIPLTRQAEGIAYEKSTKRLYITNEQGYLFVYDVKFEDKD